MLADLTANDAGFITGQVVVWVLLLAGVWKCWSIARRPTTNWKCAVSLLCFFGLLIESTFLRYLNQSFRSLTLLHAFRPIFGLVFVGTLVCGIVLAILGPTEYSRQKDRFTQGRAQAIWALVLLSLVLVCSLISIAFAPVRQISRSRSSRPGELLTFEDFNFSFRAPSRDWAEFDAAKLNQASKLGFTRSFPETYFFLTPERIGAATSDIATNFNLSNIPFREAFRYAKACSSFPGRRTA
jgi:hypothetical protein